MLELTSTPPLETPRLRLRAHRHGDFPALAAMWADPIVARYIGGKPLTEEEAWTKLLRYAGHWSMLGFGYWAVEEKASSRFLGELGFANYKRDIQPALGSAPEAGWIFSPAAHGQGYASEALREVLAWGDVHFSGPTVCLIHPENVTSIKLAEKFNYQKVRPTRYKDRDAILFSRDNPAAIVSSR
jgi:RimJ/RimL family protein N-acetyltransferase